MPVPAHRDSTDTNWPAAAEVSNMLARRIDQLARELLPAGRRNGAYWSVGGTDNARGKSMFIHLTGHKIGHWQDAGTGEFGDALDLLAACSHRGDKKAAYHAALSWLGITPDNPNAQRTAPAPRARAPEGPDPEAERKRKYALAIWLNAFPSLAGSPVDSYLAGRGIKLSELKHPGDDTPRQPRALRYHPELEHYPSGMKFPAMVAAISGPDGGHLATHRTWLERVGGGWIKLRHAEAKLSIAPFAGGSIHLWRGASRKPFKDASPDEPVVIGEGIETCLSVALACPELRIISAVSLGNFGSVWLPPQVRIVVLLADNDTKPAARQALQRVIERHLAAGRHVRLARSPAGKDFNDVLQGAA